MPAGVSPFKCFYSQWLFHKNLTPHFCFHSVPYVDTRDLFPFGLYWIDRRLCYWVNKKWRHDRWTKAFLIIIIIIILILWPFACAARALAARSRCSRSGCRRRNRLPHPDRPLVPPHLIPEQLVCLHKGPDKASVRSRGQTTGWASELLCSFRAATLWYRLYSNIFFFLQKECPQANIWSYKAFTFYLFRYLWFIDDKCQNLSSLSC